MSILYSNRLGIPLECGMCSNTTLGSTKESSYSVHEGPYSVGSSWTLGTRLQSCPEELRWWLMTNYHSFLETENPLMYGGAYGLLINYHTLVPMNITPLSCWQQLRSFSFPSESILWRPQSACGNQDKLLNVSWLQWMSKLPYLTIRSPITYFNDQIRPFTLILKVKWWLLQFQVWFCRPTDCFS